MHSPTNTVAVNRVRPGYLEMMNEPSNFTYNMSHLNFTEFLHHQNSFNQQNSLQRNYQDMSFENLEQNVIANNHDKFIDS